jgi:hypothetical protein
MTIKIIHYTPKITNAKTQYVDIDSNDMMWLQTELIRYLSTMGELDGHRNNDVKQMLKQWWYKRTSLLPKGTNGQNSPLTFVSGVLNNILWGNQRNLSTIQMDSLEYISSMMCQFLEAINEMNITPTNQYNSSFKFQTNLFPINIPT